MSGEKNKKESTIIIHLDRVVSDEILDEMVQSIVAFMNLRWPRNQEWKLPS